MHASPAVTLLLIPMVTHLTAAQGPAGNPSAGPPASGGLVVWLYVTAPLDAAERDAGLELADTLLATAGVAVDWHVCVPAEACPPNTDPARRVTVILTRAVRATCGQTALDPPGATVLVSVPCVAETARAMRQKPAARAHPLLATLDTSHLLGAAVAHEIGHVLGLKHADRGIMRARVDIDDALELRQGRLAFDAIQGARMRMATVIEPEVTRAVTR